MTGAVLDLRTLAERLGGLDLGAVKQAALAAAAEHIKGSVQQALANPPGSEHATPWRQSGTLHESIEHAVDQDTAVIGSNDPVAVWQEFGTRTDPPRPFLAPSAANESEAVSREIGGAIARAIVEATT